MTNNEIVPGFDRKKNRFLEINLKKINEVAGCLLLSLSGYIDKSNYRFVRKQVAKAISINFIHLIFDLADYSEVSEYGTASFTGILKDLSAHGGNLVLIRMKDKVYEVYQLLGFSQFFHIEDSIDDAVDFLLRGGDAAGPFPKIFKCPICGRKLKATKSGRFRCSECKTTLAIDEMGQVVLG